ncbi:hypothetical protein NHX12_031838 [Muraenolepis orangiensis]|uniref:Tetraspanin n=1 Tax=Muraenolepis orangiensis TaxID=630683 RepID=A0A9Q0E6M8_9TELE|nr:hypothetical protein NHX12_031838 [Muraenolepis orangiensis]
MGVCSVLCKVVILIFNLLYSVVGLAFLVAGIWLRVGNNTREISETSLVTGEYVLIAVAVVMLITVVFGDFGGCYNKISCLATFCVMLVMLMAAQIALYAQRDNVGMRLTEFYTMLYGVYILTADPIVGGTLRVMHYTLNCCGALGVVGLEPLTHTCPEQSGFDRFMSPCPTVLLDVFSAKPPLAMAIFYSHAVLLLAALVSAGILMGIMRKPPSVNQHGELLLSPTNYRQTNY